MVNQTDADGTNALMYAARYGNALAIAPLLQAKANINATNQNGWTALTIAYDKKADAEIIYILTGEYLEQKIALPVVTFDNRRLETYIRGILEDNSIYNKETNKITHMYSRAHRLVSQRIIPDLSVITMSYLNKIP